jgi:hydroxymethyl cephem carbamoyltransferase
MVIMALKSGHDGSVAVLKDRRLMFSKETEKNSFPRHFFLAPETVLAAADEIGGLPDVVALGGWHRGPRGGGATGAGYLGLRNIERRDGAFFGKKAIYFSSSHERSHVMMAIGMAPPCASDLQVVLVWEGDIGSFYLANRTGTSVRPLEVLKQPGARYSLLYAIADPSYPPGGSYPRLEDAGKLMALAAYGRGRRPTATAERVVETLMSIDDCYSAPKSSFRDSPLYNVGVQSDVFAEAAALLTDALFNRFEAFARAHLPKGLDLRISGGCGLNCEWNRRWTECDHFRSVFVPPCTDDSGSAIGTAIDALVHESGVPWIEWSVYSGSMFRETDLRPQGWSAQGLHLDRLAECLAEGAIVAWVQGRSEIGPRALGNRSLLAAPFARETRDKLNAIKQRECFRPIAPCCTIEDVSRISDETFADPYMLFFRRITDDRLCAVTHVDGTARVQTVSRAANATLHALLSAFSRRSGLGVLCNTSLNYKGRGFINDALELFDYCHVAGITEIVIDDVWFRRAVD